MADKPSSRSPKEPPALGEPLASLEPGAPFPPDGVDPELVNLKVPPPQRHPLLAVAVLLVSLLLLYRLRADFAYALLSEKPVDWLHAEVVQDKNRTALKDQFVRVAGIPDHRNSVSFDPKGSRGKSEVFRLLGTQNRLLVARRVSLTADASNVFEGRLQPMSEVWFAETLRSYLRQTRTTRALDLGAIRALAPGPLKLPFETVDRAGQSITIGTEQELLIDVLFDADVRVLLSKDKFPSEADARYEVERLGLAHGPGIETADGFGYVLRLPSGGAERQKRLSQIDALGIWLLRRIETYRVPSGLLQVRPEGLVIPGPASLQQPVRYESAPESTAPAAPAVPAASIPTLTAPEAKIPATTAPEAKVPTPTAPPVPTGKTADAKLLVAISPPQTVLSWETVQAVQVSEPLLIPADAWVLFDGERPESAKWVLPVAALVVLFMLLNLYYLVMVLFPKRD